jgi:hypothetical protein
MSLKSIVRELREMRDGIGSMSRRAADGRAGGGRGGSRHSWPVLWSEQQQPPQQQQLQRQEHQQQQGRWANLPPELLLDIRRLSESETEAEALLHNVFDLFSNDEKSVLSGLLSPSERRKGKISRVTFNAALKSIDGAFVDASAQDVYQVLNAYLRACLNGLRYHGAEANIANPALFKALILLFANVAERVSDRYGGRYTTQNFEDILGPFFRKLKKSELPKPATGHLALYEHYRKALSSGFSLKQWLFA